MEPKNVGSDTPRPTKNKTISRQPPPWTCTNCETTNSQSSRSCIKCRSVKARAKQWKCGKCSKMMVAGAIECLDCKVDMNGFSTAW